MGIEALKALASESTNISKIIRKPLEACSKAEAAKISELLSVPILKKSENAYTLLDKANNKVNYTTYSLLDKAGNELAYADVNESNGILTLSDIWSEVKNKGFGKILLNRIKQDFLKTEKVKQIKLLASWVEYPNGFPPHKFYMKNGFVPEKDWVLEKLTKWIENGAKEDQFPMSCKNSNMICNA